MNKVREFIQSYHPFVHVLMLGTIFINLTNSMSVVFLPIFLMNTAQLDPITVGFIVGAGAITATFGGFIGGTISDFLGRERLMLISLVVLSGVYLGFVVIKLPVLLFLLNVLRGLVSSFFLTISKALMGDLTPKEKRFRVFSNRYLAGNIGFSIGPIIGTVFGIAGNMSAFLLSSLVYIGLFIVIVFMIRFVKNSTEVEIVEKVSFLQSWKIFRKDKVLLLFIVGSIFLTTVHGEMSVTLSQYLELEIMDGAQLFGVLMSINGITVLLTQIWITRWAERYSLFQRIALGCFLFAIGEVGFAFSTGWTGFILAMIVFTFGEILIIPSEFAQIDEITPNGMRGMYYGAQGFSEIGNFIGPWFGGMLLVSFGGEIMFLTMAAFCFVSLVFYGWGRKLNQNKQLA
jgi:MFS family permease